MPQVCQPSSLCLTHQNSTKVSSNDVFSECICPLSLERVCVVLRWPIGVGERLVPSTEVGPSDPRASLVPPCPSQPSSKLLPSS